MSKAPCLTADQAVSIASRAAPEGRLAAALAGIEAAARLGQHHKTFWPDHVGHQAIPHGVIEALRDLGFHVTHKDLGAIEVHWPAPGPASGRVE